METSSLVDLTSRLTNLDVDDINNRLVSNNKSLIGIRKNIDLLREELKRADTSGERLALQTAIAKKEDELKALDNTVKTLVSNTVEIINAGGWYTGGGNKHSSRHRKYKGGFLYSKSANKRYSRNISRRRRKKSRKLMTRR